MADAPGTAAPAASESKKKKKSGSGLFGSSLSAYVAPEIMATAAAGGAASAATAASAAGAAASAGRSTSTNGTDATGAAAGSTAAAATAAQDRPGAGEGDELPPSYASLFRPSDSSTPPAPAVAEAPPTAAAAIVSEQQRPLARSSSFSRMFGRTKAAPAPVAAPAPAAAAATPSTSGGTTPRSSAAAAAPAAVAPPTLPVEPAVPVTSPPESPPRVVRIAEPVNERGRISSLAEDADAVLNSPRRGTPNSRSSTLPRKFKVGTSAPDFHTGAPLLSPTSSAAAAGAAVPNTSGGAGASPDTASSTAAASALVLALDMAPAKPVKKKVKKAAADGDAVVAPKKKKESSKASISTDSFAGAPAEATVAASAPSTAGPPVAPAMAAEAAAAPATAAPVPTAVPAPAAAVPDVSAPAAAAAPAPRPATETPAALVTLTATAAVAPTKAAPAQGAADVADVVAALPTKAAPESASTTTPDDDKTPAAAPAVAAAADQVSASARDGVAPLLSTISATAAAAAAAPAPATVVSTAASLEAPIAPSTAVPAAKESAPATKPSAAPPPAAAVAPTPVGESIGLAMAMAMARPVGAIAVGAAPAPVVAAALPQPTPAPVAAAAAAATAAAAPAPTAAVPVAATLAAVVSTPAPAPPSMATAPPPVAAAPLPPTAPPTTVAPPAATPTPPPAEAAPKKSKFRITALKVMTGRLRGNSSGASSAPIKPSSPAPAAAAGAAVLDATSLAAGGGASASVAGMLVASSGGSGTPAQLDSPRSVLTSASGNSDQPSTISGADPVAAAAATAAVAASASVVKPMQVFKRSASNSNNSTMGGTAASVNSQQSSGDSDDFGTSNGANAAAAAAAAATSIPDRSALADTGSTMAATVATAGRRDSASGVVRSKSLGNPLNVVADGPPLIRELSAQSDEGMVDNSPLPAVDDVETDMRVIHFLEDFQSCFLPLDEGLELDLSSVELAPHRTEFWRIKRLVALRAPDARLRVIPADVGELVRLREMRLPGNRFSRLPPEIGQLHRLQHLDLSRNALRQLPVQIGQLRRLRHLDLQGNQLMTLPSDIGRLLDLRHLRLSGNTLIVLPPEIGHLTQLRSLYVDGNRLAALPSELGLLRSLEVLHAGGNRLTSLPNALGKATALTEISVRDNPLTALPASLGRLPRLVTLALAQCPLTYLPTHLRHFLVTDKLQAYCRSLEDLAGPETATYRSKLLLVGYGSVGKSTLLHALFPFEAVVEKKRRNMLGWQQRRITIRGPLLETLDQSMGTPQSTLILTKATVVKGEAFTTATGQVERVVEDPENRIWTVITHKSTRPNVFRCASEAERTLLFRTASFYTSDAATVGVDVSTRLIPSKLLRQAFAESGENDPTLCRVPENAEPMHLSVLDFAGLEAFQSTHHLFLSREGVYVVLWDVTPGAAMRTVSLAELRSWLVALQLHLGSKRAGRTSPADPIVYIVGNKADLLDASETADDFRLVVASIVDQVGLTLPFRIVDPISAQSPYQVSQLRQAILADLAQQSHVGRMLPNCYLAAEQAVTRAAASLVPSSSSSSTTTATAAAAAAAAVASASASTAMIAGGNGPSGTGAAPTSASVGGDRANSAPAPGTLAAVGRHSSSGALNVLAAATSNGSGAGGAGGSGFGPNGGGSGGSAGGAGLPTSTSLDAIALLGAGLPPPTGNVLDRSAPSGSIEVERGPPPLVPLEDLAMQIKIPYEIVLRAVRLMNPWGTFVPLKDPVPPTADVVAREPTWLSVDLLGKLLISVSHTNTGALATKTLPPTPFVGGAAAAAAAMAAAAAAGSMVPAGKFVDLQESQWRFEEERRKLRCRLEHRRLLALTAWQGMDAAIQDRILRWLDELDVALPFRETAYSQIVQRWRQGGTAEYANDDTDAPTAIEITGADAMPPAYIYASGEDLLFVPFALPKVPTRSSGFCWLPWTPFTREVTRVIRLNGVPAGFHGVLLANLCRAVAAVDYWKCWRNGFVLLDGDGHALVTVDDRANEIRICSRHQRRPSTLAEKLSLVTVMLIRRKYSGAHILFEGIECVCTNCIKCKWGWEVTAIASDSRRRTLYERLGRENPMTAPHHVELSEQLGDLASAHRSSTAVGVFDHSGLERARGAGDKSILCPLHQKQVNLVQLFGGEAAPRRPHPRGSVAEANADAAEVACRQIEALNLFFDNLWLHPMPWSAFVWSDDRYLAYYETFQHIAGRALVAAALVQVSDVAEAAKAEPDAEESAVGTVLGKMVGKAAGGAFAVMLMHRTFSKVAIKRQAERLGRLRLNTDVARMPALVESVARTLTAGRGPTLLAATTDGPDGAPVMPSWGSVFGKTKLPALLQGLLLNGEFDQRIRRAQLLALADSEALLDWLMTRSTPEARDELKRLQPQSEAMINRLVTAVTLSRPL